MTSVFISYAKEDLEVAKRLYGDLCAAGCDAWLDREKLAPGVRWKARIKSAIWQSDYFLALLSEHALNKRGFVQNELKEAMEVLKGFPEDAVYLIPVRRHECYPLHGLLTELNWVDLFPAYEEGLNKILETVKQAQSGGTDQNTSGSAEARVDGISVLILTHGDTATGMLDAARVVAGELERFEALCLEWSCSFEEAQIKLAAAVERLGNGSGLLILTDILGGTPFSVAMRFREPGRIEIVSGVNLPMIVRIGCLLSDDMSISELAEWIRDKGRSSIVSSTHFPRPGQLVAEE